MAGKSGQDVYDSLFKCIEDNGGVFSDWYCGITNNVHRRVFVEHKVLKNGLAYWCECVDKANAEAVEKAFIEDNKCAGGGGGGNDESVHVYVYKMTPNTVDE